MDKCNNVRLFTIFIVGVIIAGGSCVPISIEPRRTVVRPGDSAYILCKAPTGTKLKSCKFFITGMPEIDLSNGRQSQGTDEYGYYGRGLERGQCGINLLRVARTCATATKIRTVTCAVEVEGQGWSVAYMSLMVTEKSTFPLTVEQTKVQTKVGGNVTIVCQAPSISLKSCFFQVRDLGSIDLSQGHNAPPRGVSAVAAGRVHYFGEGLEEGECGMRLTGVREDCNGLVWCAAKSDHGSWGYNFVTLEIAKPPSSPTLILSSTDLKLDDTLTAKCSVKSRPAARMYWDAPFDQGVKEVHSDDVTDARLDFEELTVTQEMIKRVTATDHLKEVRCVVGNGNNNHNEVVAKKAVKVRFCGRRNFRDAIPLAYNGVVAKSGEFPWHVGVYKKTNTEPTYICGGSLISTRHVISAAHCFWSAAYSRVADASSYSIAANKVHRTWSEDTLAQRLNVAELKLHGGYRHDQRRYEDDIAVVVLSGEVVFSPDVHPICLTWSRSYEGALLVPGSGGTIPGWGYTENVTLSDRLRYVELPYIEMSECRRVAPMEFQIFLTPDKFCAGFVNKSTSVCTGDSGGGLVFSQNTTTPYYLLGVASLAPKTLTGKCNSEQISGFTKLSMYYQWIKEILEADDVNHVNHTNM